MKHRPRRRLFWIAIGIVLSWVIAAVTPELVRDRIYPYDSALFAANGALFLSLFQDFRNFVSGPVGWLWEYYEQYPALFVRRHPPLFGVVEGVVYAFTGVSVLGAKLTVLLFALVLVIFVFLLARRIWQDELVAGSAALLIAAAPWIGEYMRSVWIDIPALAFTMATLYFYMRRLQAPQKGWQNLLPVVACAVLALYTYQLVVVLLLVPVLHFVVTERRQLWTQRSLWWVIGAAAVVVLPIAWQSLSVARENIFAAAGVVPSGWERFAPVAEKTSLAYWTYYGQMLLHYLPVAALGVVGWIALWFRRRPTVYEKLMFFTAVSALVVFSWLPTKNPRYGLYIAIPSLLLAVGAVKATVEALLPQIGVRRSYVTAAAVAALAVVQAATLPVPPFNYSLSGMQQPVSAIMQTGGELRIFYAGRFDAAFVFYVRQYDERRRARVSRATVQLAEPAQLAAFVAQQRINVLAFEEPDATMGDRAAFARAIEQLVRRDSQFALLGRYELPYQGVGIEGSTRVIVYRRGAATDVALKHGH